MAMRNVLEREADWQIRLAEHQCRRRHCGQQAEGQQQRRQHLALRCGSARCLCIVRLIVSRGRPRSGLLWQFRRCGHDAVGKALGCANRWRRECAAYRARLLVERPRLSRGCKELDGGNTQIIGPAGQILPQPVDQVFECRNIHRARRSSLVAKAVIKHSRDAGNQFPPLSRQVQHGARRAAIFSPTRRPPRVSAAPAKRPRRVIRCLSGLSGPRLIRASCRAPWPWRPCRRSPRRTSRRRAIPPGSR